MRRSVASRRLTSWRPPAGGGGPQDGPHRGSKEDLAGGSRLRGRPLPGDASRRSGLHRPFGAGTARTRPPQPTPAGSSGDGGRATAGPLNGALWRRRHDDAHYGRDGAAAGPVLAAGGRIGHNRVLRRAAELQRAPASTPVSGMPRHRLGRAARRDHRPHPARHPRRNRAAATRAGNAQPPYPTVRRVARA
jgi:hypothetical protein